MARKGSHFEKPSFSTADRFEPFLGTVTRETPASLWCSPLSAVLLGTNCLLTKLFLTPLGHPSRSWTMEWWKTNGRHKNLHRLDRDGRCGAGHALPTRVTWLCTVPEYSSTVTKQLVKNLRTHFLYSIPVQSIPLKHHNVFRDDFFYTTFQQWIKIYYLAKPKQKHYLWTVRMTIHRVRKARQSMATNFSRDA